MNATGQTIWDALGEDFSDLPDPAQLTHITVRLLLAALVGGLLGWEREQMGKAAGLRTHMLVALGSALFVLVPQQAGMTLADLSRVIQGLVAGIGFLCAGTILKLDEEKRIVGLTTAAALWLTAALGMAVGLGRLGAACVGTLFALLILSALLRLDAWLGNGTNGAASPPAGKGKRRP